MKYLYRLIFSIFVPKDLKVYAVEYFTRGMVEPKLFAYEHFSEDYKTNELIFEHETAGHTLVLNKDSLEWYTTTKLDVNFN